MEKDNYVLCPVCGKEKFYFGKDYFIFCNTCGWEGNLDSDDNMVELNGISANDYRKVYNEYLKINPNYVWRNDKDALDNYMNSFKDYGTKCPVCGEESFKDEALYCYKCGWKYDVVQAEFSDFGNSANLLPLDEYKEQFNKLISNNPNYLWKNTNESLFNFNNEQIDWMKKNNINTNINKLSSNKEISKVISSINEFWNKAQSKEEYLLIRELIGKILDSM